MYSRRDFLKAASAAAAAVACAGPVRSFASETSTMTNIIYTAANPGKWKGKEGTHAPQVSISGDSVSVVTNHPMSDAHFIVRHTLVLADGTVIGATTFTPADKPESNYQLPAGYKGMLYVTSFCNLHDFWMSEATV